MGTKRYSILGVAGLFYGSMALELVVKGRMDQFSRSHGRLLDDVVDLQERVYQKTFLMIRDYLSYISFGEARWASSKSTLYHGEFPHGGDRNVAYEIARSYHPIHFLPICLKLFRDGDWENNYGGSAWENIAAHAVDGWNIDPSDYGPITVWVDRAFDLAHNCSIAFDKSIVFENRAMDELQRFLDIRRSSSLEHTIHYSCEYLDIHRILTPLATRAHNLGFISASPRNSTDTAWYANPLYYEPVEWGDRRISGDFVRRGRCECVRCGQIDYEDDYDVCCSCKEFACKGCQEKCYTCHDVVCKNCAHWYDGATYCVGCYPWGEKEEVEKEEERAVEAK